MDKSRRNLLKGAVATGGAAAFVAGYSEPLHKMAKGLSGTSGEKPAHPIFGNAPEPEYHVDAATGDLTPNPNQRVAFTVCWGCTTKCGIRVRVDNERDEVLRVAGNPYHPLSADDHLDETTPVREALSWLGRTGGNGQMHRSTACGRGNAMVEQISNPNRVTRVLKRAGKRGEGKWTEIPFEQAIHEIANGGDLFGEGAVEGLRDLNDYDTPLDPENPEYGPKTNQLMVIEATDYGRSQILKRFTFNAFGSRNYANHGSYCGLAHRYGSGLMMNDLAKYSHVKPDFDNVRFAVFIGTAPGQAGNPFKRSGRMIAQARASGEMDYVVVDPALNASVTESAGAHSRWLPIRPATDSAFAMALLRWVIENEAYAAQYLSHPTDEAALAAGEPTHTNATHLVISDEAHPRHGHILTLADLQAELPDAEAQEAAAKTVMVMENGVLRPASEVPSADLFVDTSVPDAEGQPIAVTSSMALLRKAAMAHEIAELAGICGIDPDRITAIGRKLSENGRRVAVASHGGMMSSSGVYGTYAVQMLNLLLGVVNTKGGAIHAPGMYGGMGTGPRYDLARFDGMRRPQGVFLSRSRFPYENTSEYRRKAEAGENPYPAKAPWRKNGPPALSEYLGSALDGYPYPVKVMIGVMSNPLYGVAGLNNLVADKLADPSRIGLYVAVDAFVNETNRYADYIIPDSVMYEVWGFTNVWSGIRTKTTTACWPVVEPRQVKTAEGVPVSMESFFIAMAKELNLKGFGEGAIKAADGSLHPLDRPEDFFLRAGANIAMAGKAPLAAASADDIALSGVTRLMPEITRVLPAEEQGPVAHLFSRGGRFDSTTAVFDGEQTRARWTKTLAVYNEQLGTTRSSETGAYYAGTPVYRVNQLADGTPMRDVFTEADWPLLAFSFKSNLLNSYSAGLDRLRMIKPMNPVLVNRQDADAVGIAYGDLIDIESPGGTVTGLALVTDGVMRGAVGIEHGFGHTELGAGTFEIDGVQYGGNAYIGAGTAYNTLGFADPTRRVMGTWLEELSGAAIRQGLPVRIRPAQQTA